MTKECQGNRSLNGIMAIISKIWSQSALEHDLSLRCLVLDALPRRQSAHWRSLEHTPSACQSHPSVVLARAFKTTPRRASPDSALTLAGQTPPPPLAPARSAPPAQASRAPATVASHFRDLQPPPSPWIASPRPCEASPSLSRGISSPEKQNRPHRTSVTRRRA
jgi:hypothetical protein